MKLKYIIIWGILIGIFGCSSIKRGANKSIEGTWESLGYGRILKIKNNTFIIGDITKFSCQELFSGKISDFGNKIQLKNDTLSVKEGINEYFFTKIPDSPALCKKGSPERQNAEAKANDPMFNFEVLWDIFQTHYAYFDLRGINPEKMFAAYMPRVNVNTTEAELFFILDEMLSSFNDGHIGIEANDKIMEEASKLYKVKYLKSSKKDSLPKLKKHRVAEAIAAKYIPKGTSIKNGNLRWGIIDNNIGYFQLNQMMGLANYNISDTLSYREYWTAYFDKLEMTENSTANELEGLNTSLDRIMKEFANTKAIIIDLRFNGGGTDEIGMDVLKRFNGKEQLVFTKKARHGLGFTPTVKVSQPAIKNPYNKPVYLLISGESASATEIMVLSSLSMPNITKIGSATEGVFSDILDKRLPNGWEIGLSNEVYLDMNNNNFEGKGIKADIHIPYPRDTQEFLHKLMSDLKEDDLAILGALKNLNTN